MEQGIYSTNLDLNKDNNICKYLGGANVVISTYIKYIDIYSFCFSYCMYNLPVHLCCRISYIYINVFLSSESQREHKFQQSEMSDWTMATIPVVHVELYAGKTLACPSLSVFLLYMLTLLRNYHYT